MSGVCPWFFYVFGRCPRRTSACANTHGGAPTRHYTPGPGSCQSCIRVTEGGGAGNGGAIDVRTRPECSTIVRRGSTSRIFAGGFWGMPIRVAIVEDDAVLSERYRELIASAGDMRLEWTASGAAEALRRLAGEAPDVMLVDLGLPDGSGLDVIRGARARSPECEVMVVSVFGDEEHVVAAIAAGASGYLLKDALADSFLGTIRELRAGGSPISPSIARIILNHGRAPGAPPRPGEPVECELAEREREILSLVAKGFNFQEIGRLLGISNNTVKTHIYRIYRKLSVHSRGEAVFEAKRLGLLDF